MKTCSFLIASYNRKEMLERALLSVAKIALDCDEIIINDDGSDQDTLNLLNKFVAEHENAKLYTHDNMGGIYKNMNFGFSLCSKDIVIVCDSDDISLYNRRDVIVDYFDKHEKIDCIYHNAIVINEKDEVTNEDFFKMFKQKQSFLRISTKASFYGAMMCFRLSFIQKYNEYILRTGLCRDITLGLIAFKLKRIVFLNEKLVNYRRWSKNVSVYKKQKFFDKIKIKLKQLKFYLKFKKAK